MLARVVLHRLGLVGKGNERDRRPAQNELDRIIAYADENPRQLIPLGRIVEFAVATAMRVDEILQLEDVDLPGRLATVRDRKDPRQKVGNHQQVPLLDVNGYDPVRLIEEQLRPRQRGGRVFPYGFEIGGNSLPPDMQSARNQGSAFPRSSA